MSARELAPALLANLRRNCAPVASQSMRSSRIAVRAGGGAKKPGPWPRPIGVRADRCRTNFTKAVKRRSMLVKLRKHMRSRPLRLKYSLATGVFSVRLAAQTPAVKEPSSPPGQASPIRWNAGLACQRRGLKMRTIARLETAMRDRFSASQAILEACPARPRRAACQGDSSEVSARAGLPTANLNRPGGEARPKSGQALRGAASAR